MKFLKKSIISFLCLLILGSSSSVYAATNKESSNDIYNTYCNFDLQNYSLSYNNDKVNITSKNKFNSFIALPKNNQISNLNSIIEKNPAVKNAISNQLKNGNKIVGLSVTERYLEENYNKETKKTSYRFLTNNEVKEYNKKPTHYSFIKDINNGSTQRKGKLTLTSLLVTSPSLTGKKGVYNLVGNANWDVSGFNSNGNISPDIGLDFLGLGWPSTYAWLSGGFKGFYNTGGEISSSLKDVNSRSGAVWQFDDKIPTKYAYVGARNVTTYAQIKKVSSVSGPQTFKVQYVHTYSKNVPSVTIGISTSGFSAGLTVSEADKKWMITSPVTIE